MPQASRHILESLQPVWLQLSHLLVDLDRLMIFSLLEETPGNLALNPGCLTLLRSQLTLVLLLSLLAVVL